MQPLFIKYSFKKNKFTKNNYFFIIIGALLFLSSCQKDKMDIGTLNSTTAASTTADARSWFPFGNGKGPANVTNYGALIAPPNTQVGGLDFQVQVADQIGISSLRGTTLVPAQWSVNGLLGSEYDVVLNFNTDFGANFVPFPSDLVQYKLDLNTILATYTVLPKVAVIENEESNRFNYDGTPQDYLQELSAAIDVMHSHGIKVANGGVTDKGLNYLVYQDLLSQGKDDSAELFMEQTDLTPNAEPVQDRAAFIDELLSGYKNMDLDYVNFHWKGNSPDTRALGQVISYLIKRTGKPIISNELGQHDSDPNTVTAMLQKCTDAAFPYLLWYSPDENSGLLAYPLNHNDATLTQSGVAYQQYLKN